jgi:F0F1-type ATP synthase assembly protein I
MIAAVLLFFLVTGSVSHYVGARLRFPADMAALPLAGVGVGWLMDRFKATQTVEAIKRSVLRKPA